LRLEYPLSSNQSFVFRFAFIDLGAGPFAWGPSVGGDGVRTELSLPNVAKSFGGYDFLSSLLLLFVVILYPEH
jgi:hypothetical protein